MSNQQQATANDLHSVKAGIGRDDEEEEGRQPTRSLSASGLLSGVRRRNKSGSDLSSCMKESSVADNNSRYRHSVGTVAPFRRTKSNVTSLDIDTMARKGTRRRRARSSSNPKGLKAQMLLKRTISNSSQGSSGSKSRASATWDSSRRRSSRSKSPMVGGGGSGLLSQLSDKSLGGIFSSPRAQGADPNASYSSTHKMTHATTEISLRSSRNKSPVPGLLRQLSKGSAKIMGEASKAAGSTMGGMMKTLYSHSPLGGFRPKKSKWEEAIEAMDEILDPGCEAFQHMTPEQRTKMQQVRKLLIKGPTERQAGKLQHVPVELIHVTSQDSHQHDKQSLSSSHFILEEYAGLNKSRCVDTTVLEPFQEEEPKEDSPLPHLLPAPQRNSLDSSDCPTASLTESDASEISDDASVDGKPAAKPANSQPEPNTMFVPPEFAAMDREVQAKLLETLQWDALNKWDFNIFELDQLTNGNAMLFAGWTILGAPHSQQAMAKHLGLEETPSDGYSFYDELNMPPQKLYNFIKVIQEDYNAANPYHNSIHGADVLQSLHTLIQRSAGLDFMEKCPKLHIFAILLSALVHDVSHFGTTNAFHAKLQTELAVLYNDKSVMESWHVAHAFSRMLDLDLSTINKAPAKDVVFSKFQQSKSSPCNILCNATPDQFQTVRRLMIDAILHTDMTNHFAMVNAARALLMEQKQNCDESNNSAGEDSTWQLLMFMLHMADISGPSKGDPLVHEWRERVLEEFFAQGDLEAALGLPISPNCDRNTVVIPDSQIGFIKFVVQPAFEVLGEYIPFVQDSVLPIIHSNMTFYVEQKKDIEAAVAVATAMEQQKKAHILNGAKQVGTSDIDSIRSVAAS